MDELYWILIALIAVLIIYHLNTSKTKRKFKSNMKYASLQKTHSKKVRFNDHIKTLYFHKHE